MKIIVWIFVGYCVGTIDLISAQTVPPVTLNALYQQALEKTEPVKVQHAKTRQLQARMEQLQAGQIPQLTGSGSYLRLDYPGQSAFRSSHQLDQYQLKLNVAYPVYQGGRYGHQSDAAAAELQAQREQVTAAELALYQTVAEAYYAVIIAEAEMRNLSDVINFLGRRLAEIKSRSAIGRSKKSDYWYAQAQLESSLAQQVNLETTLQQARSNLAQVTGMELSAARTLQLATSPASQDPCAKVRELDSYLLLVDQRPDLQALHQQILSSSANLQVTKANYWPSIDFDLNSYLKRSGSMARSDWDVGLSFSWPLYDGGLWRAQVREASSKQEEKNLQWTLSKRKAMDEVESIYRTVEGQKRQIQALSQAMKLAELSYKEQERDLALGLVTLLDLLQYFNSYSEYKRSYEKLLAQRALACLQLSVASGVLP